MIFNKTSFSLIPKLILLILLFASVLQAQVPKKTPGKFPKAKVVVTKIAADTVKKKSADSSKSKDLKNYAELLKKATTVKGLFKVHQVETDYYFEIPLKLMGKDFLLVNKISSVPMALNESGVNKGMNFENKVIRFSRNKISKTVWVKTIVPQIQSPAGDAITKSVNDNFIGSVIESFKIEAYSPDSSAVVIKVNKVFDGTEKSFNDVFGGLGLGSSAKTALSSIERIKSFPKNVVVRSLLTTKYSDNNGSVDISVAVTTNLLLLPEEPMQSRFADSRVGFFSTPRWYFSDAQHKMETRELVTRWRMEPKPEDRARYLKGELVEPVKPIIYYIDPATPPLWRKQIIAGVVDWQKAFEQAGFKNAILAKEVADTADYDGDDVRYSEITYAASPKANAMGPSVIDPRSGEILEADVVWWHNVMTSLQSWIRVQTGVIDTGARANKLSDEKMAHAIRFVSSHEIGHTLGLKHNMGSSASFPVDSLRSPSFTNRMGGTASSIMDYARFNYVAQPEDHVTNITPQIGIYDKYAISWAYRWLDVKDPHQELPVLRGWIDQHANDPLYRYGEQQDSKNVIDPRSQSEDLGDDAVKASNYGLANLKRLIPQITAWATPQGEDYYQAGKLYFAALGQWQTYAEHVTANIGGYYLENPVAGDGKKTYTPVPVGTQQRALDYIKAEVFRMPDWLFNKELLDKTFPLKDSPIGPFEIGPYALRREYQNSVLYSLLSEERLLRMFEMELLHGKDNVFTVATLLKEIRTSVFEQLKGNDLSITDRMLQQNYVDVLLVSTDKMLEKITKKSLAQSSIMNLPQTCDLGLNKDLEVDIDNTRSVRNILVTPMSRISAVASAKRGELLQILNLLEKRKNRGDEATQGHYQDLILRIRQSLQLNK
ncbi:zinc-dependent metalloprotease [Pedobacter sp. MC2016-14]|uniref:zinc-dependent metalloprotease n=1 Tax=Pedobacter sp. MC2016-14 TaxID=2897327 RepID=UPI001E4DD7E3|nr:zinc-dependent metalloprotease [Pedobacter sp. MC2016-14]MCD0488215.1 zinc-dependent metalloprotease [Pedobacter sp. MC2016-14]